MKAWILALLVLAPAAAHPHSMFNSAEEFHGGYRVQVATAPEFPQIGEPSTFMVRLTDADFEEVDRFTMGLRFFYHGQQVDAVPPTDIRGAHWDFDYVWEEPGNHVVRADLYLEDGRILTYTFNMGTQSPFGQIFIGAITVGALVFAGVMIYIMGPRLWRAAAGTQRA
ncbi:MAG: hypothetical protein MPJ08_04015 [Nitrosopumilus sp.]|nr:hypothetical protein [Nitrosopumilus sp.]